MLLIDVLRHLHARGHIPEHRRFGRRCLAWAAQDGGLALIRRYQRYQRLPETGVVTGELEARLTAPRCGHPDIMAVTAGSHSAWGTNTLTYWQEIVYPGVDPAELAADYALAVSRVTAVCGLTVSPAASAEGASIIARSRPIDGPWYVLALSELPPPGNTSLTLKQEFDVAETGLTRAQRQAMMAHEFCHCLGLGHCDPGSGNLMEPSLSHINSPQAWDTKELLARYPLTAPTDSVPGPVIPAPRPPHLGGVPVEGNGSIVTTVQAGARYNVELDGPGRYLIMVVPLDG
jgi:hypothetical protein